MIMGWKIIRHMRELLPLFISWKWKKFWLFYMSMKSELISHFYWSLHATQKYIYTVKEKSWDIIKSQKRYNQWNNIFSYKHYIYAPNQDFWIQVLPYVVPIFTEKPLHQLVQLIKKPNLYFGNVSISKILVVLSGHIHK